MFNEKLLELRKQKGWSQEELGYKINVSRQTISKWEAGQTTPELEKLKTLAQVFEISVDELIDEEYKKDNQVLKPKKKYKKIIIAIILIFIIAYMIIVGVRTYILYKVDLKMSKVYFESFNGFELKKNVTSTYGKSFTNEEIGRTEYYFLFENNIEKGKILYFKTELEPYMATYTTKTYLDNNITQYENVEVNLKDKTYKTNMFENKIQEEPSVFYNEWNNMFNMTKFLKNKIFTAMDFRIKISKSKETYYISNYELNEPKMKDSIKVKIDMNENNNIITLEKTEHNKENLTDSMTILYEIKPKIKVLENNDQEINNLDLQNKVKIPDLSEYKLIEE